MIFLYSLGENLCLKRCFNLKQAGGEQVAALGAWAQLILVMGALLLAGKGASALSCPRGAPGSLRLVTLRFAWFKV